MRGAVSAAISWLSTFGGAQSEAVGEETAARRLTGWWVGKTSARVRRVPEKHMCSRGPMWKHALQSDGDETDKTKEAANWTTSFPNIQGVPGEGPDIQGVPGEGFVCIILMTSRPWCSS